jgi:ParB-like chromosome segregation protein Spo0J
MQRGQPFYPATVFPDDLEIPAGLRPLNEDAVIRIMESVREIGLKTPIAVRWNDDDMPVLIAGRHRVEACRRLGTGSIPCITVQDEREARLWEISENLHRAELTARECAAHIAEWIRLTEAREVLKQVASKPQGGRPESGTRAAARELGIGQTEAQRAVQIDRLTPAADAALAEAGLLDNQTVLLTVAKAPTEAQQLALVAQEVERRRPKAPPEARIQMMQPPDLVEKETDVIVYVPGSVYNAIEDRARIEGLTVAQCIASQAARIAELEAKVAGLEAASVARVAIGCVR